MSSAATIHNTAHDWLVALVVSAVFFAGALLVRRILSRKLSALAGGSGSGWLELLVQSIARLHALAFLAAAVYLGALKLSLPEPSQKVLGQAMVIVFLVQVAVICSHGINFWVDRFSRENISRDAGAVTTVISVSFLLHLAVWIILILIGLDNLGVNITALIAGLGITGIAVALAVQNILGDLFASFSIVLDKPFVIGDFIAVDTYTGAVEHIGLKTTRIRSPSGEQLIFANADLLKSRIRNYQRMRERRVTFSLRLALSTPVEKLREVPGILRSAVEKNTQARFERAHCAEYVDHALRFEIVYQIITANYNQFMDVQHLINLEIHERFMNAGIEFA